MEIKLFDSELRVMDVLWHQGNMPAGQIAGVLKAEIGWSRNTTYTVINKCIEKGVIRREEPKFTCHALIGREEVQRQEVDALMGRMFDGSVERLFAAMVGDRQLSRDEISGLRRLVEDLEE